MCACIAKYKDTLTFTTKSNYGFSIAKFPSNFFSNWKGVGDGSGSDQDKRTENFHNFLPVGSYESVPHKSIMSSAKGSCKFRAPMFPKCVAGMYSVFHHIFFFARVFHKVCDALCQTILKLQYEKARACDVVEITSYHER